ncbi:MAG: hypothetical protein ICV68_04885 [Pyrinomonadaceae bacterium]|nr:hypothetical protein [Pyrinomonadaceae bacterium]
MMNRRYLASVLAILLLTFFSTTTLAAVNDDGEDTDTRIIDARVVEVTDGYISVIARSGVEHVIKIDNSQTRVLIEEQEVSLKDVREGDVITVDLDEQNPMKFAKTISMTSEQMQVARVRR